VTSLIALSGGAKRLDWIDCRGPSSTWAARHRARKRDPSRLAPQEPQRRVAHLLGWGRLHEIFGLTPV